MQTLEWTDYTKYPKKLPSAGPTCVAKFADGQVTRMSIAQSPKLPPNCGRALRVSIAAYQSRMKCTITPMIIEAYFERDGELLGYIPLEKRA